MAICQKVAKVFFPLNYGLFDRLMQIILHLALTLNHGSNHFQQ